MEAATALGGSFKLVTLAPKTVREMSDDSTAQGNTKEWEYTNKLKSTNGHTKHKPTAKYTKNSALLRVSL